MSNPRQDHWFQVYWRLRRWSAEAYRLGPPAEFLLVDFWNNPAFAERTLEESITRDRARGSTFEYPREFVEEGLELARGINEARQADVKENVYQAAVVAMTDRGWNFDHLARGDWLFRGERSSEWSRDRFGPSIFRNNPSAETLALLRRKLDVAAYWFRKEFADRNDTPDQLLAVLQHYGQPTWLLDVSTSIFVALFFASEADEGEGVVYAFNKAELRRHRDASTSMFPEIRQIVPQFVPRIARQHAVFLDGGEGRTIRNMVFHQLRFKQSPGMRFEDPQIGIGEQLLLEQNDEWRWFEELSNRLYSALEAPLREVLSSVKNEEIILDITSYEDEQRAEAQRAPLLEVIMPGAPQEVASVKDLTALAERTIGERSCSIERRREAAEFLARFYRRVCLDPETRYQYFCCSIHTFLKVANALGFGMEQTESQAAFDVASEIRRIYLEQSLADPPARWALVRIANEVSTEMRERAAQKSAEDTDEGSGRK